MTTELPTILEEVSRMSHGERVFRCNDEKLRTLKELAAFYELPLEMCRRRIIRMGLTHPDLFAPKCTSGRGIGGGRRRQRVEIDNLGESLKFRRNLGTLPSAGSLERKYLGG